MNRVVASGWVVAVVASVWAPVAKAAAHVQFIDMGTPKSGAVVMNGWRGVVVRVSLDGGLPITRVDLFGDPNPETGTIAGNMAQRWTDPTGQGNYTETSPGPLTANNTFDSDFNFDSHLLGPPEEYTVQSASETCVVGFFTNRTGLSSNGFVGYGAAPFVQYGSDPIVFGIAGHVGGFLQVNPAFQSDSIDLAYIVTDGAFQATVRLESGTQAFMGSNIYVPEPGGLGAVALIAAPGILRLRRRRGGREAPRRTLLERLEARTMCSLTAPVASATLLPNGSTQVTWADVSGETGYWVERSRDLVTWQPVHATALAADTTSFTNRELEAGYAWYRVKAVDATSSAASNPVQIWTGDLEVEAEALPDGVRIKWPHVGTTVWIYRKAVDDAAWPTTELADLDGGDDHFDDHTVAEGQAYEYRVQLGASGVTAKYVYAGRGVAAAHDAGRRRCRARSRMR
jgi:hypothetical protein